jgi:ribose/xylose/arabinose/galactoside ABC-type transport system permease subunit
MPSKPKSRLSKVIKVIENILLVAAILVCAYLVNNYFFTVPVIVSVLKGVALISVLAMAESIVMAGGGIDLSVASISLVCSSIIFYFVETDAMGVVPAILISTVAGCVIGLLNGVLIAKLHIMPIITTMGTALFARGISGAISNNIYIFDSCSEFAFLQSVPVFVIPVSLIIALFIMLGCYVVFRFTVVGRQVFAVGGSERSAKLSGLNVDGIKIASYAGAGFIAGIGGLMVLADSSVAARFFGAAADVEVLLAAIIGGVSLHSGAKTFFRACVGASIIAVINRLLYGLFVFDYMRAITIGLLLLVVVAVKKNSFKSQRD